MYKELKETGLLTKQYRKSIALVAAMRLKQHQPEQSLEILSIYDDIDVNIRYVRMLSNLYLNRFDEVFRLLKMTTIEKAPKIPDQLVNQHVFAIKKIFAIQFIQNVPFYFVFFLFKATEN